MTDPHAAYSQLKHIKAIVIGGSAGSFQPIYQLVRHLPENFPIPVFIVLHRARSFSENLTHMMQSKAGIRVKDADDKESIQPGVVYFAPADYHLLIEPNQLLSLDASEPEWFCRPAIDPLFVTAADAYGTHLAGFILSGANSDGAKGLSRIAAAGGTVFIQNPETSDFPVMPQAALAQTPKANIFEKTELPDIFQYIYQNIVK